MEFPELLNQLISNRLLENIELKDARDIELGFDLSLVNKIVKSGVGNKDSKGVEDIIAKADSLQTQMKEIIDSLLNQQDISLSDLLVLQSEIHKICNYIELISKLLEQAINSLKTTLQQQL